MGSRSCQDCHQQFYELWSTSFHGLAMQNFTQAFASENLLPCEQEIIIGDQRYHYALIKNKGYIIENPGQKRYPIDLVLGGKYLYYFLTPFDKGKLQTLPLGFDVKTKEWFDITSSSVRMHQTDIDEALSWKDRRYTFNSACYDCHVSQLTSTYNIESDSYQSMWLENGINCETCHGPAELHNEIFTDAQKKHYTPDSSYLKTFTRSRGYNQDIVDASCSYCHAKAIRLTKNYIPGEAFFQHFDLICAENEDYYPDARDLGENYSYGTWLMSPCRSDERMDCLHCHTSSGRFKQKQDPNTSCLPCHADRVANASAHTHHPEGSAGNLCIACHMPKTQFARMDRSDHSMRPPVPALTASYGSPNACNTCHTDKSPQWAESFILEHFSGSFQKDAIEFASYLDALRKGDAQHLAEILIYMQSVSNEFKLSSMIRSLDNIYDPLIKKQLIIFMTHPSPLVRASTASILGSYRDKMIDNILVNACMDSVRLVRIRAIAEIIDIECEQLNQDEQKAYNRALEEYKQSLMAYPDEESSHYNMGHYFEMKGETSSALTSYKNALKLRPELSQASNNIAMIYYENAQIDSALYYLQNAVNENPNTPVPYLNLGLLYAELSFKQKAIEQLELSIQKESTAVAAYNLSVLYSGFDSQQTLKNALLAYELSPLDAKYAYSYAYYLSENGKSSHAIRVLQEAVNSKNANFNIYYLLSSLYKNTGESNKRQHLLNKAKRDNKLSSRELEILDKQ